MLKRPATYCLAMLGTEAIEAYSRALILGMDESIASNRSAAHLAAGLPFEAIEDALSCIQVGKTFIQIAVSISDLH